MYFEIDPHKIPYDRIIQGLCATPFKGNPRGCMNLNNKEKCPPRIMVHEFFDFSKQMFAIVTECKIGQWAEGFLKRHECDERYKLKKYPDSPKKSKEIVNKAIERLRSRHPDWPDTYFPLRNNESWESCRGIYNPRHWQGTARNKHSRNEKRFLELYPKFTVDGCPEAMGVNVTGLMAMYDIKLTWRWPPVHNKNNITYRISLAGARLK